VVNEQLFGLPADYLGSWRERIRAVTAADVQRVAKAYLRPDQSTLVVVAKAQGVEKALGEFGKVTRLEKPRLIR
jgi:zinc protease